MAEPTSAAHVGDDRLQRLGVTPREAEVLRLVAGLWANGEIAARLGVSKRTVESHVSALLRKFGVKDRAALIRTGGRLVDERSPRTAGRRRTADQQSHQPRHGPRALAAARRRLAAQRRRAAYRRAVQRERDSITVHESAANHLDALAAAWEQHASTANDEATRARDLRNAETAHQRAQAARERAAQARQRLQVEGIDPNTDAHP